jgi:hypothetical protein
MGQELDVPKFLRAENRGKRIKVPKASPGTLIKKTSVDAPDPVEAILEGLTPEVRAEIEKGLASGAYRRAWLSDPSTIGLIEHNVCERAARREEGLSRLRALGEERKKERALSPPKPVFGATTVIKSAVENPRKPGTGAHARYDAMRTFVAKARGKATVAEVMAATGYRKDDFEWDVSRGYLVTDVKR